MEHAPSLDRPFPWRGATAVLAAVAAAELLALLALAGVRLVPGLHRASPPAATTPALAARAHPRPPALRRVAPLPVHALRPVSRLSVLVLNGNGRPGAAGTETRRLVADGYGSAIPADAPSRYARSLVLFAPGYELEGRRLARRLGIRVVDVVDGMRPAQLRGTQLVVILGGS